MKNHDKNRVSNQGSKVWKFRPQEDDDGRYVPYCDFGYHLGVILDENICEERQCDHYMKLYLDVGVKFRDR